MKLLLIIDNADTRKILNKLFRQTGHIVEWRDSADCHGVDLTEYDMLLIDGSLKACEAPCLRDLLRKIRNKFPRVQIVVLDVLSAFTKAKEDTTAYGSYCGAVKSGKGMWQLRCCLHELALTESQALLLDTVRSRRVSCEPITFEYQG